MYEELEVTVTEFKAEYASCGSHRLKLTLEVDIEELEELAKVIKEKMEKYSER